jgi:hypothetical protein
MDRSVVAFQEALDAAQRTWDRVEFWRTRNPAPQSVRNSHPKGAFAVLVQRGSAEAGTIWMRVRHRVKLQPSGRRVNALRMEACDIRRYLPA